MMKKQNVSETLEKGMRILDLYCGEDASLSLSEISRRIGINKTSVYRYVNTLCNIGYLQKDEQTKRYSLGIRTIPLAHALLDKAKIVRTIKPYVDQAHNSTDLHIDVGIIQNNSIYLVYRRESRDTRAFLHFTSGADLYKLATGKAAMAFFDDDLLSSLLDSLELKPKTPYTILDKEQLRLDLQKTRERGYSTNREEFLPGLVAIGAPIFNLHSGQVVGGVSFDAATTRFSMEELEKQYVPQLLELAKTLSAAVSS